MTKKVFLTARQFTLCTRGMRRNIIDALATKKYDKIQDLAFYLMVDVGNMSRTLKELESLGIVKIVKSKGSGYIRNMPKLDCKRLIAKETQEIHEVIE